ncbi:hypothetical protein SUGI_0835390 [Cryptomeria japonica]|nr:hypothetical protein SUGI_0835390 [Cryptomeria japonica]
MPAGLMVPARHVPPLMARQSLSKPGYTTSSPGLSLAQPNMAAEGQFDHDLSVSARAESEGAMGLREEELESKSGSDNIEGGGDEDQDVGDRRPRKKRYHRHTQHQIQEMEMFFKECPHPDDKQRKELSRELGLEPLQVKFWFQNKRTQMKTQHERHENSQLRSENEKLRAENMRYREALSNASCPNCGGPAALGEMSFDEQQLRVENARLREEIDRISGIAAKYVGKPLLSIAPAAPPLGASLSRSNLDLAVGSYGLPPSLGADIYGSSSVGEISSNCNNNSKSIVGPSEVEKPMVVELAVTAMEELVRMAQMGEPLWTSHPDNPSTEILNQDEYITSFPRGIGPTPFGSRIEASRATAIVIMNAINLVETLMDVNQWSSMFPGIISRAFTVDVFSTGVAGNYNGALQVMYAEFHVPSPLVPTRENYLVRYCKQHSEGLWAIADVSLESLRGNPANMIRCRRRPSGCLIQEMPNGYSKVTWVEHIEVDERAVHHIYRQLVNSSLAFGAKRWIANLERQCERLASVLASNINAKDLGVIPNPEGRKSMLKLAERMGISFCGGVSASSAHTWTSLSGSGAEDVRVMIRKSVDDPGRPPGIVLSAATSFWLPVPPKTLFDFLRDENSRNEWDILSNGGLVQEMAHIANGQDPGNCVSLLRVNSVNSNQSNMLILQESCVDAAGSFVIYAPVDIAAMNEVLNGADPDYVAILPSGFAILPDGPKCINSVSNSNSHSHSNNANGNGNGNEGGGSLLTVAFQILSHKHHQASKMNEFLKSQERTTYKQT